MKYRHKATVIDDTDDRHFISESEIVAVQDIYNSRSQSVDILNVGVVDSTIDGMGEVNFGAKSMVNLLKRDEYRYKCIIGCKSDGTTNTSKDYNITQTPDQISVKFGTIDKGFSYIYFFIGSNNVGNILKPGKKYTFFVDVYISKDYLYNLYPVVQYGHSADPMTTNPSIGTPRAGWNRMRGVLTCKDSGQFEDRLSKSIYMWFYNGTGEYELSNMEVIMKNAMFIEGDIPMAKYPGYFEGYTSTLDTPAIITSYGSNHIDMSKLTHSNALIRDIKPSQGYIRFKKKDDNNGTFIQFKNVPVEKYTDYCISYDVLCDANPCELSTYVYSENSDYYDPSSLVVSHCPQFNTGNSNKINIGIYVARGTGENKTYEVSNIRLTKGSERLPFEPYKENKVTVKALSLKELPTGVKDTLEGNKLTRRVGRVILDGSEPWGRISETVPNDSKTLGFFLTTTDRPWNMKHVNTHFSDTFMNYGTNAMYDTGDFEQIGRWSHGGSINIRISRNRSISDVTSFKNWLKKNPVTVYYELEHPTVEYVDITRIGTYDGTTHIKTDANFFIPMTVTTTQNVQVNVDTMKREVIDQSNKLTSIKNIQLAVLANLI